MFRSLRGISGALQALVDVLLRLLEHHEAVGGLVTRVEELERSRALWEAEMQAELVKVQAKEKAVRASEQRTHDKLKKIEQLEADLAGGPPEVGELSEEEYERLQMEELRGLNGEGGGGEGLQPMHEGVGRRAAERARARSLKWHR